jgi:hypothetical protein
VSVQDGRNAFERSRGRGEQQDQQQEASTKVEAGRELHRTGRVPDIRTGEEGTEITS